MLLTKVNLMRWFVKRLLEVPDIEAFTLVYSEEFAQSGSELDVVGGR